MIGTNKCLRFLAIKNAHFKRNGLFDQPWAHIKDLSLQVYTVNPAVFKFTLASALNALFASQIRMRPHNDIDGFPLLFVQDFFQCFGVSWAELHRRWTLNRPDDRLVLRIIDTSNWP